MPKYKNQSFQEKNFYKEFNLNLIENSNTSWRSSYEILDSDSLIVSTNSTLGLELFSRNFKVVFFGLRSVFLNDPSMRFGWPLKTKDTGPFWCNLVNENEMFNTLESVLNMDQENWNKKISDFKSVMMYDYKNKKFRFFFVNKSMKINNNIKNIFKNKSILITGGTGSFGKEFIKLISKTFLQKKL